MSDFPEIAGYKILDVAGRGGMSTVYRAFQEETGREVALKLISASNQEQLDQFSREGEIIASLEHPHILPVYDFGFSNAQPFLVMRLLEGGSLADWVRDGERPDQDKVFESIAHMAEALDFSHARGVLHRDVKPSNMLLDQSGFVYLSDFGIAMFPSDGERRGLGSAAYISPEQARGEIIDGRADIYSLSVTLYELLTGEKPYTGKTAVAVMVKQINEPVPDPRDINPDISRSVADLIRMGMSKKAENRPQSAGQFGQLLQFARRNPDASVRPSNSGVTIPFRTITPPKGIATIRVGNPEAEAALEEERRRDRTNRWLVIISASILLLFAMATALVLIVLYQNPDLLLSPEPATPVIVQEQEETPNIILPIETEPVSENLIYIDKFDENSSVEDCEDGICFVDGALQIETTTQDLKLWPVPLNEPIRDGVLQAELSPSARSNSYSVGLVCRLHQTDQGATFITMLIEKSGGIQTTTAFRIQGSESTELDTADIPEELFITDARPFNLELRCLGSDIELFINDFSVLASRDEEIAAGTFGVMTSNTIEGLHQIRFDKLEVFDEIPSN